MLRSSSDGHYFDYVVEEDRATPPHCHHLLGDIVGWQWSDIIWILFRDACAHREMEVDLLGTWSVHGALWRTDVFHLAKFSSRLQMALGKREVCCCRKTQRREAWR